MVKPLLITTFLLLTIGIALLYFQEHKKSIDSQNLKYNKQKLLEELDTKELNKINIRADGYFVSLLQLKSGGWQEQSSKYDADIISIQDLLLKLTQTNLGNFVTSNTDYHERFRLLEPPDKLDDWKKEIHGNSITLLKGDDTIIFSLLLGKNRKNNDGQYIRYKGSNEVFQIHEIISVNSNFNEWLNKELLNLDSKLVSSIKINYADGEILNINRKSTNDKWSPVKKSSLPDEDKIQNILDRVGSFSFSKLLVNDQALEKLLITPENTMFIKLFDGKLFTLKIRQNVESEENYIISIRMGIVQDASGKTKKDDVKVRTDMEDFNQKMNGRFFEISSWEAKELLLRNE